MHTKKCVPPVKIDTEHKVQFFFLLLLSCKTSLWDKMYWHIILEQTGLQDHILRPGSIEAACDRNQMQVLTCCETEPLEPESYLGIGPYIWLSGRT